MLLAQDIRCRIAQQQADVRGDNGYSDGVDKRVHRFGDVYKRQLWGNTALFLVFFLAFVIRTLLADGYAVRPETGEVFMEPYKYLTNFLQMPVVV